MPDSQTKKIKKKNNNKDSRQKKINKTEQKERNSKSRYDPITNSQSDQGNGRSTSRGRISTCYRMVVSRLTRPFGRGAVDQNQSPTTPASKEGHLKNGPPGGPSDRDPKLDMMKYNRTHQRDLFDAVQDLLKPKKSGMINDIPRVNLSFSISFHSKITSVLIEMFNNIPDINDNGPDNADELFQSQMLRELLTKGGFASFDLVAKRDRAKVVEASSTKDKKEENKRWSRRRLKLFLFFAKANRNLPKPRPLSGLLQTRMEYAQPDRNSSVMQTSLQQAQSEVTETTLQKLSTATRAPTRTPKRSLPFSSVQNQAIKGDPFSWINDQIKYSTRSLNQKSRTKTAQAYKNDRKMQRSLEEKILYSVQNKVPRTNAPTTTLKQKAPITAMQTPFVRILIDFERETRILSLNKDCFLSLLEIVKKEFMIVTTETAREAFMLNSLSADTVSRRNTHSVSITVELPGFETVQVRSVPVSLLQRFLHRYSEDSLALSANTDRTTKIRNLNEGGRAIDFGIACVTTVRRLKEMSKRMFLPNEATMAVAEHFLETNMDRQYLPLYKELGDPCKYVTIVRQAKHRLRPILEEAVAVFTKKPQEQGIRTDTDKAISGEEQDRICYDNENKKECKASKKVLDELTREGIGDDNVGSKKYKFFSNGGEVKKPTYRNRKRYTRYSLGKLPTIHEEAQCELTGNLMEVNEPTDGAWLDYSGHGRVSTTYEQQNYLAVKGEASKDFQEFNTCVPTHLGHIEIPFKDITDVEFETDEEGNPILMSSGGFGDIYKARKTDTNEKIIVKIVVIEDVDFEAILQETRIQMYLVPGPIPAIKGVIFVDGQSEIMILQQFCAGGRTLYDVIQACMAETLTLLESHWLQLAFKLVLSFDHMHKKGVLHNDIKPENILVELKPCDARPYIIDFGMATFRKGGRLVLSSSSDCNSEEEHLAPEVRHSQPSSPKSDVYSLGKVFQEMAYFCAELSPLSHDMCADDPEDRPTLDEIADEIEDILDEKGL